MSCWSWWTSWIVDHDEHHELLIMMNIMNCWSWWTSWIVAHDEHHELLIMMNIMNCWSRWTSVIVDHDEHYELLIMMNIMNSRSWWTSWIAHPCNHSSHACFVWCCVWTWINDVRELLLGDELLLHELLILKDNKSRFSRHIQGMLHRLLSQCLALLWGHSLWLAENYYQWADLTAQNPVLLGKWRHVFFENSRIACSWIHKKYEFLNLRVDHVLWYGDVHYQVLFYFFKENIHRRTLLGDHFRWAQIFSKFQNNVLMSDKAIHVPLVGWGHLCAEAI